MLFLSCWACYSVILSCSIDINMFSFFTLSLWTYGIYQPRIFLMIWFLYFHALSVEPVFNKEYIYCQTMLRLSAIDFPITVMPRNKQAKVHKRFKQLILFYKISRAAYWLLESWYVTVVLKVYFSKTLCRIVAWTLAANLLLCESRNLTKEKSTLVQVIVWCCQATSHYLSQCWHRSMSSYGVTKLQWVCEVTDCVASLSRIMWDITVMSYWARWHLKSPASRLFTQPFIKENIKAPRHWPLCWEITSDRWIPRTTDQ